MRISLGTVEWEEPQAPVRRGLGRKLGLTLIAITLASVAMMNSLASEPIALVEDGRAQAAEVMDPSTADSEAGLEGTIGYHK
jgi:hypothetical protein